MSFPSPNASMLDRLLGEQAALLGSFAQARDAGISTDEGVGHLLRVQARLQDHLATVDRHVYPLLRRLGATDARVFRTLARVQESEVSGQVQEFFDQELDASSPQFFSAWGAVYIAVQRRFRLERTVLFPALQGSSLIDGMSIPTPAARLRTGPMPPAEERQAGDGGKRHWRKTP